MTGVQTCALPIVVDALDRSRDQSLAARPAYQAALAVGGNANAGIVFVDVDGARGLLENAMIGAERSQYEQNGKPFVTPFSHFVTVNTTEGSTTVSHVLLYVK